MDLDQLRELIRIFESAGVSELILESGGEKIVLRKSPAGKAAGGEAAQLPHPAHLAQPVAAGKKLHTVTSPMVATLYRASSPGAPPFVSVGDQISEGQVLCILECMKIMNHLESEVSGRIKEILAGNAQTVEFGQPLFIIEVDE